MRFRRVGGDFRTENRSQNRLKTADRMWNSLPEPGAGGGFGTTWHASLKIVFHTGKLFGMSLWKTSVRRGKPEVLHLFRRVFHTPRKGIFSQGKSRNAQRFSVFPFFSTPVFHPFPQLLHNLWKTLWKLWEKDSEDGGTWWCVALGGASQQRRSRLLAPRLGRGSLCGNDWWVRVIFGICAASLRMTRWGTGAWYQICLV